MAELETGKEILQHILRRAGELLPTDTNETTADHLIDAKLYINSAYVDVCGLKPWRWARKRKEFSSVGKVTGTASSISGTTVTNDTTIATSMTGRKIVIDSDGIPHRIQNHTAGTNVITLESAYTGTSTSGQFTIFQDEITVASDILAFPVIRQISFWPEIKLIPEKELIELAGRNILGFTQPRYASFITDSVIRISPWTEDPLLFEISYNYRPTSLDFGGGATDTPILPRDSRIAIAQRALVRIYTDKRDGRLEIATKELDETLHRMSSMESSFNKPRAFIPPGYRVSG